MAASADTVCLKLRVVHREAIPLAVSGTLIRRLQDNANVLIVLQDTVMTVNGIII